jgi:hypothetical protein
MIKYKKHFPHLYNQLLNKIENNPETNCYDEFVKTYNSEYADPKIYEMRQLFSLVKEENYEGLKTKKIPYELLELTDKSGRTPCRY